MEENGIFVERSAKDFVNLKYKSICKKVPFFGRTVDRAGEYESLCLSSNKLQEKTPQLLEGLYKVSVV